MDRCVSRVVRRFSFWSEEVDSAALNRDDYHGIFAVTAWQAQLRYSALPNPTIPEYWYVSCAVRRTAIDCLRRRERLSRLSAVILESDGHVEENDFYFLSYSGLENRIAAREALRLLRQALSHEEWVVVVAWAIAASYADVQRFLGKRYHGRHNRYIDNIVGKAREILADIW